MPPQQGRPPSVPHEATPAHATLYGYGTCTAGWARPYTSDTAHRARSSRAPVLDGVRAVLASKAEQRQPCALDIRCEHCPPFPYLRRIPNAVCDSGLELATTTALCKNGACRTMASVSRIVSRMSVMGRLINGWNSVIVCPFFDVVPFLQRVDEYGDERDKPDGHDASRTRRRTGSDQPSGWLAAMGCQNDPSFSLMRPSSRSCG